MVIQWYYDAIVLYHKISVTRSSGKFYAFFKKNYTTFELCCSTTINTIPFVAIKAPF